MNSIGQLRSKQQINFNIFLNSTFVVASCTSTRIYSAAFYRILKEKTSCIDRDVLRTQPFLLDGIRYENIRDT